MELDELNRRLASLSNAKDISRVKDLHKIVLDINIWYQAYQNIYSNRGAFTKGINNDTLDKFDQNRVYNIIKKLRDGSYSPNPVRRVNIPKPNGKLRPLGIPSGTDKLVQEVFRIILESIYEPKFSDKSHGFRPNRSCHTALREVSTWAGTKWWIEFDIKGCFDNINHDRLIVTLEERIADRFFINIIRKFLEAGYVEHWKFNNTYSGTPQGGIISPILTNIYLDKLDKFIESKCEIINKTPYCRDRNPVYRKIRNDLNGNKIAIVRCLNKVEKSEGYFKDANFRKIVDNDPEFKKEMIRVTNYMNRSTNGIHVTTLKTRIPEFAKTYNLNEKDMLDITKYEVYRTRISELKISINKDTKLFKKTKCTDTSNGLNRLHYVRYADDFILGSIGSKADAMCIVNSIRNYIETELKMNICEEKTRIVDYKGTEFLGYKVEMPKYTDERMTTIDGVNRRRCVSRPKLRVPVNKLIKFVSDNQYGDYVNNISEHRTKLINFDDIEIVRQYNAELRGLFQFYKYASDCKYMINRVQWLGHYSLFKTLGAKHRCSVSQLFVKNILRSKKHPVQGRIIYIKVNDMDVDIFNIKDVDSQDILDTKNISSCNDIKFKCAINIKNSALKKLIANECEICGAVSKDVMLHEHHTNPLCNIDKNTNYFKRMQMIRSRKTVTLCEKCHYKIHGKNLK